MLTCCLCDSQSCKRHEALGVVCAVDGGADVAKSVVCSVFLAEVRVGVVCWHDCCTSTGKENNFSGVVGLRALRLPIMRVKTLDI